MDSNLISVSHDENIFTGTEIKKAFCRTPTLGRSQYTKVLYCIFY